MKSLYAGVERRPFIILAMCFVFIFSFFITSTYADTEITLEWDSGRPAEPGLAKYRVYYRTESPGRSVKGNYKGSGLQYKGVIYAGNGELEITDPNIREVNLTNLIDDKIYFFAISAVSEEGLESDLSNEVGTLRIIEITSNKANGYYKEGDLIDITVTFSQAVTLSSGGNIQLTLDTGDTINISAFTNQESISVNYSIGKDVYSDNLDVTAFEVTKGTLQSIKKSIDVPQILPPGKNLGDNKNIVIDTKVPKSSAGTVKDPGYPPYDDYKDSTAFKSKPIIANNNGQHFETTRSSITLEGSIVQGTAWLYINAAALAVDPSDTEWSYNVDLEPGVNVFEVYALDLMGNESDSSIINIFYDADSATPPVILAGDVIPHNNAGISDNTRIPNNTSFAVRIRDSDGIDLTLPDSVEFNVKGEVVNLGHAEVNHVILGGDEYAATDVWVGYHRISDSANLNVYDYEEIVEIYVIAYDVYGHKMESGVFRFRVETEEQKWLAYRNSPDVVTVTDGLGDYNAGIEIVSGELRGAKILYNHDEGVLPSFGPTDELDDFPVFTYTSAETVGGILNLQPPTIFKEPVTIFIPFDDETDVSKLDIYLYSGGSWELACNAAGMVQSGGEGWMVPGSRRNHNSSDPRISPSTIEIKVYHFTGVAAGRDIIRGVGGVSGGGGSGCFIATAAYGSPFHGHVGLLREFRDFYLMRTGPGRVFVELYYKYSPVPARFIAEHASVRVLTRLALAPLVALSYAALNTTDAQKGAALLLVLVVGAAALGVRRRRFKVSSGL